MGERLAYLTQAEVNESAERVRFTFQSSVEGNYLLSAFINIFSMASPLRNEVPVSLVEGENVVDIALEGMTEGDYRDAHIGWALFSGANERVEKYLASGSIRR